MAIFNFGKKAAQTNPQSVQSENTSSTVQQPSQLYQPKIENAPASLPNLPDTYSSRLDDNNALAVLETAKLALEAPVQPLILMPVEQQTQQPVTQSSTVQEHAQLHNFETNLVPLVQIPQSLTANLSQPVVQQLIIPPLAENIAEVPAVITEIVQPNPMPILSTLPMAQPVVDASVVQASVTLQPQPELPPVESVVPLIEKEIIIAPVKKLKRIAIIGSSPKLNNLELIQKISNLEIIELNLDIEKILIKEVENLNLNIKGFIFSPTFSDYKETSYFSAKNYRVNLYSDILLRNRDLILNSDAFIFLSNKVTDKLLFAELTALSELYLGADKPVFTFSELNMSFSGSVQFNEIEDLVKAIVMKDTEYASQVGINLKKVIDLRDTNAEAGYFIN